MCLAACRAREQTTIPSDEPETPLFEMVPHWPGIIEIEDQFQLTQKLLTKESLLDHRGILRLAFELPPIMLPRKVK